MLFTRTACRRHKKLLPLCISSALQARATRPGTTGTGSREVAAPSPYIPYSFSLGERERERERHIQHNQNTSYTSTLTSQEKAYQQFPNTTRDVTNRSLEFCQLCFEFFDLESVRAIEDILTAERISSSTGSSSSSRSHPSSGPPAHHGLY